MQENMHYYSNSLLFPGTYQAISQLSFTLQLRSPNPKSVYVSLAPPQAQREWLVSYSREPGEWKAAPIDNLHFYCAEVVIFSSNPPSV